MKKFLFISLAVLLFVACGKDDDVAATHKDGWSATPRHVEFGTSYRSAKAGSYGISVTDSIMEILMGYHRHDKFAVWAEDSGDDVISCFSSNDTVTRNVIGGSDSWGDVIYKYLVIDGVRSGGPMFYVAYPYNSNLRKSTDDGNVVFNGFNVPQVQYAPVGSMDSSALIMCGKVNLGGTVFLDQACAVVLVNIKYNGDAYSSDPIAYVNFKAKSSKQIFGHASVNFDDMSVIGENVQAASVNSDQVFTLYDIRNKGRNDFSSSSLVPLENGVYCLSVLPAKLNNIAFHAETKNGKGTGFDMSDSDINKFNLQSGYFYDITVEVNPGSMVFYLGSNKVLEGYYEHNTNQ